VVEVVALPQFEPDSKLLLFDEVVVELVIAEDDELDELSIKKMLLY